MEQKIKLSLRLNQKQHEYLKKQAAICGLKVEPYLRKLAMNKEIRPRPPDEYVRLAREVNAIGNNINQIAYIANSEKNISQESIDKLLENQDELIRLMRSVR